MNEHKIVKITDLGTVNRGKSKHRPRNDSILYGGEYPFIQTGDVKKANLHLVDYTQTYNDVGLKQSKLWKKGTLCFTIAANIADSAILGMDACFPDSIVGFLPYENVSDTTYVKYLFDELKLYFQQISKGTTQDNLSLDKICRVKLRVPDYDTQVKVASILSTYDTAIENNNKRIRLLEQMAENLYKEWFVRFRFPGYENESFIEGIPSSWRYVQLGDIASFDRGISYSSDEINCDDGINLINLKNIQSYGGFRRDGTKQYNGKYKDSQIVAVGDLILGVTDMTQDRRTVGSVALIPQISGTSAISADLVKVNLKVPNVFFYCMCRYGFYSKFFSQFANGANVLHLKPKVLLNKKILLPTAELIEAFVEKVQPMIDIVDDLNCQNDLLIKQRDMLLPRLMSGKLEV
ncbi:restriction modification system DNA specificity domain protein [Phascolarctobacterium succinatutens CAG:287]|uniref:Restriction modification system DNA specificity domain protein n=1 Tax=Phascolarctobacterium succinatutens CAG:287 TaxID=1263101 RepID=R6WE96_9FIRM|nr:restriction endonuclease subunit S [Phascolarctobacterium succinatutens]CDD09438.1 restriction modification system DNA specificity domain protein [Phascolarctobacterium succinatutens CAG:287]